MPTRKRIEITFETHRTIVVHERRRSRTRKPRAYKDFDGPQPAQDNTKPHTDFAPQVIASTDTAITRRDWGLTEQSLNRLLEYLDPDREQAGYKYELIRRKLIKFFEHRGSVWPEDQADETINRVARKIQDGQDIWVNDPAAYFYGVGRNVLRDQWRNAERPIPLECLPLAEHPATCHVEIDLDEAERRELERSLEQLEMLLSTLPEETRELITGYYSGEKTGRIDNRRALAGRFGIPVNALRIRAYRIRERLKGDLAEMLQSV
jgi:DNA-directed RNA polymerase specialized sigma24 family protein